MVIAQTSPEAVANGPGAVSNGPGAAAMPNRLSAGDAQAEGHLLEAQAVQGLCQLLEHHLAVLGQSQKPLGNLLQADHASTGVQKVLQILVLPGHTDASCQLLEHTLLHLNNKPVCNLLQADQASTGLQNLLAPNRVDAKRASEVMRLHDT